MPAAAAAEKLTSTIGVNVAGYLTAESGLGTAARGYARGLQRGGVPVALNNFEVGVRSRKSDDSLAAAFAENNPYPINLICVNADQIPAFVQTCGEGYFSGKYNIAVWFWELPDFPQEYWQSFRWFHEIWVATSFTQQALARCSPIPVVRIPPSVTLPDRELTPRSELGLPPDEFLFLFMFDFLSVYERKNPAAAIRSFRRAFEPDEPVRLILKCINSDKAPEKLSQLKHSIGDARVTLMDQYLSPLDTTSLVAGCDAYLSLHRSEGLGLPLIEAMLLRKPVVATGWSGNADFMTAKNSYPVPYRLVVNDADAMPYRTGEVWAEADEDAAASAMKDIYKDRESAALKAVQAATDAEAGFSEDSVAAVMRDRLASLQTFHPDLLSADASRQNMPAPFILDELVERQLDIISTGGATAGSDASKSILRKLIMPVVEKAGYLGSIYSHLFRRLFTELASLKTRTDLVDNRTRRQLADADARIRALEEELRRLQEHRD